MKPSKSSQIQTRFGCRRFGRALTSGVSLLSMAAALSLGAPQIATAQDTAQSADAGTEVVVTGIKRSVAKSIATKRSSNSIVEVVTAEDIGKLPDVSIAESLARLPGVAAQRVDGRSQALSIRGLAPKFSVTLLNGLETVSTGDDRSFEYDQFPSEMVSSALIYKTPDAALGTQGLSGTVDIRTIRPLDIHGRKINFNARVESNSNGTLVPGNSGMGKRFSASYINQFADGKVGVALGYAHLDSPTQKKYFNPWDYDTGNNQGIDGVTTAYIYNGFETGVASTTAVRDGWLGVVEFKPNDNVRSQVNLFYSDFDQQMNGRELIGVLPSWSNGSSPVVNIRANGTADVSNMTPIVTQRKNDRKDKIHAISWTNELKFADWTVRADLGLSKADRKETVSEAYATSDPMSFNVALPTNYSNFGTLSSSFDFGNPANFRFGSVWWGGGAYASTTNVVDEMNSARFSAKRRLEWGAISGFEGGVFYSERSKDVAQLGQNYDFAAGTPCSVGVCAPIPANILQKPVDLGFVGVSRMISFDVLAAIKSGAFTASPSDPRNARWNWGVNEKITTAFAKFDLDFKMLVPVRGNVGVQFVAVKQRSTGLYVDDLGVRHPASDGANYTDVLPSLNLIGNLDDNTLLRFSVAKTVARPNMVDMRAGITGSVGPAAGGPRWSGSGGNPKLKPFMATNYDLSLEKYFGKNTYLAVAYFKKDLSTAIYTKTVAYDFTGFVNSSGLTPVSNIGTLNTPTNVKGGYIRGWELSGALEAGLLTPMLDGFGVLASYSDTKSNIPGNDANGNPTITSVEGLSGQVWGLTGFYEKHGFQARISQRYRSAFTAKRHNAFLFAMDSIRPEKITDAQIGYTFEDGTLKGLGILLQVNNLTDTPYVVTQTGSDGSTILQQHHEFGTQYLFGVSYKF